MTYKLILMLSSLLLAGTLWSSLPLVAVLVLMTIVNSMLYMLVRLLFSLRRSKI